MRWHSLVFFPPELSLVERPVFWPKALAPSEAFLISVRLYSSCEQTADSMPRECTVLEHERGQLHVVKAWTFPARIQTCLQQETHQGSCS